VVLVTTPPNDHNSAAYHPLGSAAGTLAVAGLLCVFSFKQRRNFSAMLVLIVGLGLALGLSGCDSSYKYPGTTVGQSTLTVTAQSGSITKTVTVSATITQ
jgi:hypothetical protein